MLAFWKLFYAFVTSRAGEWTLVVAALVLAISGAYFRGHSAGVDSEKGKEAVAAAEYQADMAKKTRFINDQNIAYSKSEAGHKATEATLQGKLDASMAAAGKKPVMCSDSKEVLDDTNAIIGSSKRKGFAK